MNVFITGADGMLGTAIVRQLLQEKHTVTCLIHPKSKSQTLDALPVRKVYGTLASVNKFKAGLSDIEAVIHVAASCSVWPRKNPFVYEVNLEGTKKLVQLSKSIGVRRFIHIGSASSFDPGSIDNPGTESSDYTGFRFKMDYIDSKKQAQDYVLSEVKETGFPAIVINPTYMIGPYDSGPSSGQMILSAFQTKFLFWTNGGKSFVSSLDVATAVVNALSLGRIGECYIAGGENLTYKSFFHLIKKNYHLKKSLVKVPQWMVMLAGFTLSVRSRLNHQKPLLSFGMARLSRVKQFYSNQKAINELNMPCTPISETIDYCVAWFQENKYQLS